MFSWDNSRPEPPSSRSFSTFAVLCVRWCVFFWKLISLDLEKKQRLSGCLTDRPVGPSTNQSTQKGVSIVWGSDSKGIIFLVPLNSNTPTFFGEELNEPKILHVPFYLVLGPRKINIGLFPGFMYIISLGVPSK